MSAQGAVSKKDRLTLTQLAGYDDILTDALVDHVPSAPCLQPMSALLNTHYRSTIGQPFARIDLNITSRVESTKTM